jgi:hypothetical protein
MNRFLGGGSCKPDGLWVEVGKRTWAKDEGWDVSLFPNYLPTGSYYKFGNSDDLLLFNSMKSVR